MPSRTIRPTEAPAAAPFAYTIGTTEGLAAESVFAQWDGSGAGGDFLPCVSYYNAEGVLLDRAFPDGVTLHAGDTAEVSYRPFKRGGGGGGASLTVEDFITSVTDTTEIRFRPPMSVFQTGPGQAMISLDLGVAYAFGSFSAFSNPPTTFQTITTQGSVDVATVGGFWIIQTTGVYLCTIAGTTEFPAGEVAFAEIALFLANTATGVPFVGGFTMTPDAIPAGPSFVMNASASAPRPLSAGDSVGVSLGSAGSVGTIASGGGRVGLVRVA